MKDILDLHTHTIASGHAYNTLFEMFEGAYQKGLSLFGSSDHAPSVPGSCSSLYFKNLKVVPRNYKGMPVILGSEVNIIDEKGKLDLSDYTLKQLDYVIASIHKPCYPAKTTTAQNTSAVIHAIQNPYVNIIGHPDDMRFPLEYRPIVEAAKSCHKLLEVNSSSLHPNSTRVGAREAYLNLLPLCAQFGVSILIGSDAHVVTDIGNHKAAIALLEEIHFPEELIVNTSLEKISSFIPKIHEIIHDNI